jgi:hypothetical protein
MLYHDRSIILRVFYIYFNLCFWLKTRRFFTTGYAVFYNSSFYCFLVESVYSYSPYIYSRLLPNNFSLNRFVDNFFRELRTRNISEGNLAWW